MGLINNIGRSGVVVYGSQPVFKFSIEFMSPNMTSVSSLNTQSPLWDTNNPTTGTITIAGASVTLVAADIISPMNVAKKIKASGVSGYNVGIDPYNLCTVILQSTTLGPIAKPTCVLGTATNIIFNNFEFTQGVLCPTDGNYDDILIQGVTPVTLYLNTTSVTATVYTAVGSPEQQKVGGLTYAGTALSFTNGISTLTTPVNYIRVTTTGVTGASQVRLGISR